MNGKYFLIILYYLLYYACLRTLIGSILEALQAGYNVANNDNIKADKTTRLTSLKSSLEGSFDKKYISAANKLVPVTPSKKI